MKHELLKAITKILAPDYIKMAPKAMEAAKKIYDAVDFKELECSSEHIETLIPELDWQHPSSEEMIAKTPFGNYSVYKTNEKWLWAYHSNLGLNDEIHHCESLVDGVVLSNQDWHTKVLSIFA
jgi:hypothetical protein